MTYKKDIRAAAAKANLKPRLAHLLQLIFLRQATEAEKLELTSYMDCNKANVELYELLIEINLTYGYSEKEMNYMMWLAKVPGLHLLYKWHQLQYFLSGLILKATGMTRAKQRIKTAAALASLTPDAATLIVHFFNDQATQKEKDDLDLWMNETEANGYFFDLIIDLRCEKGRECDIAPELAYIQRLAK